MATVQDLYSNIPRQGPGNDASTRRAYLTLQNIPENPSILDIGCGTGSQTLELARLSKGKIIAVDNYSPSLNALRERAGRAGFISNIEPKYGSMFELDFPDESFDVIWSEGAIYLMGFEAGLKTWKRLLRPGGYLAVSELSWLKNNAPHTISEYWAANYPKMQTINENVMTLMDCGYMVHGFFTLPEEAWWKEYYTPLEMKIKNLRHAFSHNPGALTQVDETEIEIDMYRKYSEWYGYVFYIMKKPLGSR